MIAIGFSAVSLAAIVFGVTTRSRRRKIWRAVAGLVSMAGELCMLLFSGRSELILLGISKVYSKLHRSRSSRSNIRMLLIRRSNEHDQVSTISIMAVSKQLTIIPGTAYVLHTFAWVSNILIVIGLIVVGLSADAGHKWAGGDHAYQPISS